MKSYFITGTDTDCGKTFFMEKFIDYLKGKEKTVGALKPVATGVGIFEGVRCNEDTWRLHLKTGQAIDEINPMCFSQPASPHWAAKYDGQHIQLADVVSYYQSMKKHCVTDYLLVEGAGGLLVPLNNQHTWVDFIHETGIPIILVVGMKLGCLNHAMLTCEVMKANNLPVAGWVANILSPNMLALDDNIAYLKNHISHPFMGTVDPHGLVLDAKVSI